MVAGGFINYPFLCEHDPLLQQIRGERRFTTLMEQVKARSETLQV